MNRLINPKEKATVQNSNEFDLSFRMTQNIAAVGQCHSLKKDHFPICTNGRKLSRGFDEIRRISRFAPDLI